MKNSDGSDAQNLTCMKSMCKRLDALTGSYTIEDLGMTAEDTKAAKDMRDAVIKYLED